MPPCPLKAATSSLSIESRSPLRRSRQDNAVPHMSPPASGWSGPPLTPRRLVRGGSELAYPPCHVRGVLGVVAVAAHPEAQPAHCLEDGHNVGPLVEASPVVTNCDRCMSGVEVGPSHRHPLVPRPATRADADEVDILRSGICRLPGDERDRA